MTVALFGAGGFLAGVLLVAVLGGAKGTVRTTTQTTTVTRTVVAGTDVPDVVGDTLDEAIAALDAAGFGHTVRGGGVFGIVDESNWDVVAQDPQGGARAGDGATVHLDVERA
jgi:beta-lactam-binding protein with PASTA domain